MAGSSITFSTSSILFFLALSNSLIELSHGHGYMYDPPSRSSVWRVGFPVPEYEKNYNDMQLNCGGREVSSIKL
jgi:hypothetical protein